MVESFLRICQSRTTSYRMQSNTAKPLLSRAEVNAENAFKCLTYLSFAEFRTGPSRTQDKFGDRLHAHPFLCHASKWWPAYARNANSSSEELNLRVLEFFMPSCRPQFMSWLQVICSEVMLTRQDVK